MNINFTNLTKLVKPKGVIHVGANTCQELTLYLEHEIHNRLWIEPNKDLYFPIGETIIHAAISEYCGSSDFYYASNNGESSSILPPILHNERYKGISFDKVNYSVPTYTLGQILNEQIIDKDCLNYLVLDIQGAELKALQGLGKYANHFDVIITEAYTEELYQDCGKLDEIEALLSNYKLIEFAEEVGKGWGDAAFVRKDLLV
jgi:FkbM family methyltransferase